MVLTLGVFVTVVGPARALVDINANLHSIAMETRVTLAVERARGIKARGIFVAVVRSLDTFVDVRARHTIAFPARETCASKAPDGVGTERFIVAVVASSCTFIDIIAHQSGLTRGSRGPGSFSCSSRGWG